MPAPKSKSANGSASAKASRSSPGSTVPPSPASKTGGELDHHTASGSGKPDKAAYDAKQQTIKTRIDSLQAELAVVREKISLAAKSNSGNDRQAALRAELNTLRDQQSSNKASRGKVLDQLKALQDSIHKKTKDLQAARGKTQFRSVEDLDNHVRDLEMQVESGSMKLADEKRALQEIVQAKRARKTLENFQATQDSIDTDRRAADELRKQLDDPDFKAMSERYDSIKAELDELKRMAAEANAGRTKLFDERDGLQAQINALFTEKRASAQRYQEEHDRYWIKVQEDRARRAEKLREQRAAEEAQKKLELAERMRDEASLPAFQAQIEDCQTLIDALSGKSSGNVVLSSSLRAKADLAGVPKLDLRKVEAVDEGLVVRKKKGEEEESYFSGKGKKGKKDRAVKTATESNALNLPFGTITALSTLAIPLPTNQGDVPRVIEDLKTKKAWFEANQARVTAENVTKAEVQIQRLTNGFKQGNKSEVSSSDPSPDDDHSAALATPVDSIPVDQVAEHS
ncbi:hypothetical protein F5I97DRAFT_2057419 [Phlebopus sp. FC_14]|nr:hypothetical protein F5I97DRAFT_2057419 [Phlebopus sp. FC_14]